MKTMTRQGAGSSMSFRVACWSLLFSLMAGTPLHASAMTSKTQTYKNAPANEVKSSRGPDPAAAGKSDETTKPLAAKYDAAKTKKKAPAKKGDLEPAPLPAQSGAEKKDAAPAKKDEPKKEKAASPQVVGQEQTAAKLPEKAEEKPKESSEESSEKNNWITLSGTGAFVSGDKSAFRARKEVSTDLSGGVQDFHTEGSIAKDTTLKIDGRGLFDNHDYLLKLDVRRDDVGYVNAGYREYRIWYDNTGGFFPKNGQWIDLYNDQVFAIDRANIWFESGLTLPDLPEFIFRYERNSRDGRKDSTGWGDSNLTGGFGAKRIVPSFWRIDEKRDIFNLDMKHKVEDTAFGVGVRYELTDQDNGLYMRRMPDEPGLDRDITHREVVNTDNFSVHGFQETDFGEGTMFTTAYAFTTMDSDIGGSRIYGAGFDAPFVLYPNAQAGDTGFINLAGGAKVNQHVANLNYITMPWEDVSLVLALRIDDRQIDGISTFQASNIAAGPVPTLARTNILDDEERLNVAQKMEVRYNGVNDWLFYARADWEEGKGDWIGSQTTADTGVQAFFWDTDIERFMQKYTLGSNWYPMKEVNTAVQYYFRLRETDYSFSRDSTINSATSGNRYPMYITSQGQLTHDVNFRVTSHPCSKVTLVSRYDFQLNQRENGVGSLETVQSGDTRTHILSQNITVTPMARLYMQGNVNWVYSETDTQADERTGAAIDQVWDSQNSYWYASFLTGYALTETTDVTAQYSFYRAYDYLDQSSTTMPYGAGAEEHSVGVGLLWRMAENIRWNVKYSFLKSIDSTSGGNNNFDAHLAYSSIEVAF